MNEQLINDFLSKNTPPLKEDTTMIPEEEPMAKAFIPSEGVQGINMSDIYTLNLDEVQLALNNFAALVNGLNNLIVMVINHPDEEDVDTWSEHIKRQMEDFGIPTEHPNIKDTNMLALVRFIDFRGYLEGCIHFIMEHYSIIPHPDDDSESDTDTNEATEDLSDERFLEMLATEMTGGTDGVPFSDEELYGKKEESEYIPPMMGHFTVSD